MNKYIWPLIIIALAIFPHLQYFGNWNYDPKFLCLIILAPIPFLLKFRKLKYFSLPWIFLLLTGLLSSIMATNQGVAFYYWAFICSLWLYYEFFQTENFKINEISKILAIINALLLIEALAQVFLRKTSVFSDYLFNSYLGSKNAQSIWFAVTMPFLLLITNKKSKLFYLLLFEIIISTYVILVFRTRSAWWLLAIQFVYFAIIWIRSKKQDQKIIYLVGSIVIALAGLILLPNQLRWLGDSPYLTSLKTMTSFKYSSGRWELWKLATSMLSDLPFFGRGLENFFVLYKEFLPLSQIDPKTINNLRFNQYVMNDYLQALLEGGIVYFIIYCFIFLITPFYFFKKHWQANQEKGVYALVLVLIGLNGLIDIPMHTPALPVLFVLCLSQIRCQKTQIKLPKFFTLIPILTSFTVAILVGGSFLLRMPTFSDNNLNRAYQLWKWDQYWDEQFLKEGARDFVKSRFKLWPMHETTDFIAANYEFEQKNYQKANQLFIDSIATKYHGRCHKRNFLAVQNIFNQQNIFTMPIDIKELCEERGYNQNGQELIVRFSIPKGLTVAKQLMSTQFKISIKNQQGQSIAEQVTNDEFFSITFLNKSPGAIFLKDYNGNRNFSLYYWDFVSNSIHLLQKNITKTAAPRIHISNKDTYFLIYQEKEYSLFKTDLVQIDKLTSIPEIPSDSKIIWKDDHSLYFSTKKQIIHYNIQNKQLNVLFKSKHHLTSFTIRNGTIQTLETDIAGEAIYLNGQKLGFSSFPTDLILVHDELYLLSNLGVNKVLHHYNSNTGRLSSLIHAPEIEINQGGLLIYKADSGPAIYSWEQLIQKDQLHFTRPHISKTKTNPPIQYMMWSPIDTPIGVVVMIHGGPHLRDDYRFDYRVQKLLKKNFGVVKINYRGSSGYGNKFENHNWRDVNLQTTDINAVINNEPFLKDKKIILMGESYGNYIVYNLIHKSPNRFDKAILVSATYPYDIPVDLKQTPLYFFIGINDEITSALELRKNLASKEGFLKERFNVFATEGHTIRRQSSWQKIIDAIQP